MRQKSQEQKLSFGSFKSQAIFNTKKITINCPHCERRYEYKFRSIGQTHTWHAELDRIKCPFCRKRRC